MARFAAGLYYSYLASISFSSIFPLLTAGIKSFTMALVFFTEIHLEKRI
jgi:hypothetical protein